MIDEDEPADASFRPWYALKESDDERWARALKSRASSHGVLCCGKHVSNWLAGYDDLGRDAPVVPAREALPKTDPAAPVLGTEGIETFIRSAVRELRAHGSVREFEHTLRHTGPRLAHTTTAATFQAALGIVLRADGWINKGTTAADLIWQSKDPPPFSLDRAIGLLAELYVQRARVPRRPAQAKVDPREEHEQAVNTLCAAFMEAAERLDDAWLRGGECAAYQAIRDVRELLGKQPDERVHPDLHRAHLGLSRLCDGHEQRTACSPPGGAEPQWPRRVFRRLDEIARFAPHYEFKYPDPLLVVYGSAAEPQRMIFYDGPDRDSFRWAGGWLRD